MSTEKFESIRVIGRGVGAVIDVVEPDPLGQRRVEHRRVARRVERAESRRQRADALVRIDDELEDLDDERVAGLGAGNRERAGERVVALHHRHRVAGLLDDVAECVERFRLQDVARLERCHRRALWRRRISDPSRQARSGRSAARTRRPESRGRRRRRTARTAWCSSSVLRVVLLNDSCPGVPERHRAIEDQSAGPASRDPRRNSRGARTERGSRGPLTTGWARPSRQAAFRASADSRCRGTSCRPEPARDPPTENSRS